MHNRAVSRTGRFAFALLHDCITQAFRAVFILEERCIREEVHVLCQFRIHIARNHLDTEQKRGVRRDHRERRSAIAHCRRHAQPANAAFAHPFKASFPALDHLAGAHHSFERLAQILGATELAAREEPARVMNLYYVTCSVQLARARLFVVDLEPAAHVTPF